MCKVKSQHIPTNHRENESHHENGSGQKRLRGLLEKDAQLRARSHLSSRIRAGNELEKQSSNVSTPLTPERMVENIESVATLQQQLQRTFVE